MMLPVRWIGRETQPTQCRPGRRWQCGSREIMNRSVPIPNMCVRGELPCLQRHLKQAV
jgi:hypothetical protein